MGIHDYVTGGEGSNAPVPAGVVAQRDAAVARIAELERHMAETDRDYKEIAEDGAVLHATIAGQAKRIAELELTIAAQAQEIGRLRATDPGIEIAPGVRLVWQRGDVGVLTFEPGAVVPEESHELAEAGVVIGGSLDVAPYCVGEPGDPLVAWRVPAGSAHTMTAGSEGAVVGLRWLGTPATAPADPPPLAAYMPVNGLSTEALADGLRALSSSALCRAEASGDRVKGIKVTLIMERP